MKIIHMLKGHTVKTIHLPKYSGVIAFNRIYKTLDKAGHFLETGYTPEKTPKGHFWIITNCGDNCIKIYPED